MLVFQDEEYEWYLKHQQTLRHSTKNQFTIISKKRKTPPNSMPLSFEEIKPCKGNEIESNVLKSGYSPKKKKSKQPEKLNLKP